MPENTAIEEIAGKQGRLSDGDQKSSAILIAPERGMPEQGFAASFPSPRSFHQFYDEPALGFQQIDAEFDTCRLGAYPATHLACFRHRIAVFKACYIQPTESDPNPAQWVQWAAGLAVALGTRRGELMHTRVPDVDIEGRRVTLRVTKNGEIRKVFVNDLALQVLTAMGISERKRMKDRGVLFPGVTPEQLSMRFIRACRDAGVEDFSFHDLRHTYASHLRMKGADLDDIRRLLGHSDLRMTIRYTHLGQSHLDAAASRRDGVLTLPAEIEE